jgi:hypothetical protein
MNLFGKKKEQPKPTIPQPSVATNSAVDTIRTLRDHAETLDKREMHISKKVEAALADAKLKAAKKDKKGMIFRQMIRWGYVCVFAPFRRCPVCAEA